MLPSLRRDTGCHQDCRPSPGYKFDHFASAWFAPILPRQSRQSKQVGRARRNQGFHSPNGSLQLSLLFGCCGTLHSDLRIRGFAGRERAERDCGEIGEAAPTAADVLL
jgi:hypothetical protein